MTRASDTSFNARWTETRRQRRTGSHRTLERGDFHRAADPRTEQRLRKNPLGIYVTAFVEPRTRFIRRSQAMNPYFRKSVLPLILLATSVLFAGCATQRTPPPVISLDEPV